MMAESFEESNLQALLEKISKDEGFKKPKYFIGNASKPGQNFVGRVFRVNITESEQEGKFLSLIFKASSTNLARQDKMGGDRIFKTESDAYEIVFPALNNFLKKHRIVNQPIFPGIPRCYATELNAGSKPRKSDIIVLEDKQVDGFEIIDITKGLNGEQCRVALNKLALLHASSMALRELEPETADELLRVLDKQAEDTEFFSILDDLKQAFIIGLDMLDEPYKPGNPVYDNLYKLLDDFHEQFTRRYKPDADLFCITHSDCSSNNILFKLNKDGSTQDACLIDFQGTSVTNPVHDLAIMLLVCTTKVERDKHFPDLLKFYHDEVARVLRACGCNPGKIFPWDMFQKHLRMHMKWGVAFSLMALPVMFADESEINVDIHSAESDAVFSDTAKVKDPETLRRLKKRLTDLVFDASRWDYI